MNTTATRPDDSGMVDVMTTRHLLRPARHPRGGPLPIATLPPPLATRPARWRLTYALTLALGAGVPVPACAAAAPAGANAPIPATHVASTPRDAAPLAVTSVTVYRDAGVHSFWLSNNIRLHVRPMPGSQGVSMCLRALGGELHETAATRGLTAAAAGAWQPDLPGNRPLLITVGAESIAMRWQGNADGLSRPLQYAASLLMNPTADEARWPSVRTAAIARAQRGPLAEGTSLNAALSGSQDLRALPPRADVVGQWTAADADRWLKRVLADAPIEMAIAGDITLEQALALVKQHLAGVESPARVSDQTHAALRVSFPRTSGGVALVKGFRSPRGIVHLSLPGPDTGDLKAVREATLACAMLKERLNAVLKADPAAPATDAPRGTVIAINPSPSRAFTGQGTIFVTLRLDNADDSPRQREQLVKIFDDAMGSMVAPSGINAEQLARAVKSVSDEAQTRLKVPDYWAVVLSFADFYALSPDDLATAAAQYRSFTVNDVRTSVLRMGGAESVRVAVMAPSPEPVAENAPGKRALPISTAGDRPDTVDNNERP